MKKEKAGFVSKVMVLVILFVSVQFFSGCGEDRKVCVYSQEGKRNCRIYQQYGIADSNKRDEQVHYQVSTGNVIWGIILVETIVAPIVIFGWFLYEPVGPIQEGPE